MSDLLQKSCKPCQGGVISLTNEQISQMLKDVENWEHKENALCRAFHFENYYETIAFVNAVAWVSHKENHHPVLEVAFRSCTVRYWTHAISGISENDFICAAKVDNLL